MDSFLGVAFLKYVGPERKDFFINPRDRGFPDQDKIDVSDRKPFPVLRDCLNWFLDMGLFKRVAVSKALMLNFLDHSLPDEPTVLPKNGNNLNVLFITANEGGYTGARYHNYEIMLALAKNNCKVHCCTDKIPVFASDFPSESNISWELKDSLESDVQGFDLVIGAPPQGLNPAYKYASRSRIPFWAICYETEPWLFKDFPRYEKSFLGPSTLDYFLKSDKILAASQMCVKKCAEWDTRLADKAFAVEPFINFEKADAVTNIEKIKNPEAVFCGRIIDLKGWRPILQEILNLDFKIDLTFIGNNVRKIEEEFPWIHQDSLHKISLFEKIPDSRKFQIFKRCSFGIVLSHHEGFGMVPAEFLYCKKPFIAKDHPQLRAEYGDRLLYLKEGASLSSLIEEALRRIPNKTLEERKSFVKKHFSFQQMVEKIKRLLSLKSEIKEDLIPFQEKWVKPKKIGLVLMG